MRKLRAFTLIEVLVVVSIIALMISILMPSLSEVRRVTRRTLCQKNLDQIGIAVHNYLMANRDTFPTACRLPSWELNLPVKDRKPPITEVLKREIRGGSRFNKQARNSAGDKTVSLHESTNQVFCCPSDKNTMSTAEMAARNEIAADEVVPTERYFDNEGTSYEWEDKLNWQVLSFNAVHIYLTSDDRTRKWELARANRSVMWMLFDFEAFHGGSKIRGSQNILFTDMHVDSDKWLDGKSVGHAAAMIPTPVLY